MPKGLRNGIGGGLLILGMLAGTALGQTPQDVQEAERARAAHAAARAEAEARSAAARAQEQRLATDRVAAAARLRGLEQTTAETAERIAALRARQQAAQARIAERAATLAPMLPVMERLALYPAETLLAVPLPPEQAVRGLLVLGGLSRRLEREAVALRDAQAQAMQARRETEAELPRLAAAQTAQAREAAALDSRIEAARQSRKQAEDEAADAARQAAAAASRADSLRAAIARIEAERRAAEARARAEAAAALRARREAEAEAAKRRQEALARPAGRGLSAANSRLTVPVTGQLVRGFGDASDGGPSSGMTWTPVPGARVVAPCGGRVAFADRFRSYGLLLILDCGGGWHAVLGGLERLDAQVGENVQQGEPVGAMLPESQQAGSGRGTLYMELRRSGRPVDPAPYLRARG
ncbi:Peptidoglycan DD-metalloendopeptidase family protein [Rhodovastum atsumiense]|uniref:Peptidoglycan DD-metalloendopeptidase family protein n=1 Tax=Rhodovastum atsumiense TaxID=504468 RepID=A0A5M6IJ00_9PROT|nr:peptidoglycan DD-metalloendopeptidase family protein [Rhodovastum atsumiense]KAA5608223.1 peptidoglycan DD-metalloendopeptidase family protein [Rhodovastum atsumiense]CAH2599386.1 Peptidoglycan DD-metalloendopeptidase family protein [Rhodovastum atsumiense]